MKQIITFLMMTFLFHHAIAQDYTPATCANVINGEEGMGYEVSGEVTFIERTVEGFYGRIWEVSDETGSLRITDINFPDYSLELLGVGSDITIQGTRKTVDNVVELTDCHIVKYSYMPLDVDEVGTFSAGGGTLLVVGNCNGDNHNLSIDYDKEENHWLSFQPADDMVGGIEYGTFYYYFTATANEGEYRSAIVTFSTTRHGKTYAEEVVISQKGANPEAIRMVGCGGCGSKKPQEVYDLFGHKKNVMSSGKIFVQGGRKKILK